MSQSVLARNLEEAMDPEQRDSNLWAKCFVDAEGDEKKAQAMYVKAKLKPASQPQATTELPTHGWCPSCSAECRLDAASCARCKAIFGSGGWMPTPYRPEQKPSTLPSQTEAKAKSGSSVWKWILGVPAAGFVLMMIIGTFAGNSPEAKEQAASRAAISYCWDEQARKSLSDSMARVVAGACEKMEEEYKVKWGRKP